MHILNIIRKICPATTIIIPMLILQSCGGLQKNETGSLTWRYGNFCGNDWPLSDDEIAKIGKEAGKKYIMSISPKDSIDGMCKNHDICFILEKNSKYECDKLLGIASSRLDRHIINWERIFVGDDSLNKKCNKLIDDISHYAISSQIISYERFIMDESKDKPKRHFADSIGHAIDQVVATGFAIVAWPVLSIRPMTSYYPGNDEKCILKKEYEGELKILENIQ